MATTSPAVTQNDVTRAQLAYNAGFRGAALVTAIAVSLAENNSAQPELNDTPATGDYSVGYWQINYFGNLMSSRTAAFGPPSLLLTNQQANANAAYALSGGGKDFTPWSTWKDGKFRQYLPEASLAASMIDPTAAVSAGAIPMPSGIGATGQLVGLNANPGDAFGLPGTIANALIPGAPLVGKLANLLTPENLKFSFEIAVGAAVTMIGVWMLVADKSAGYVANAVKGAASGVEGGPAGMAAGAATFAAGTRSERRAESQRAGRAAADRVRLARQRRQEARNASERQSEPPSRREPFPADDGRPLSPRSKARPRTVAGRKMIGREAAA